jgi:TonB family protein
MRRFWLFLLFFTPTLAAQSTLAGLQARLVGKSVFLSGEWAGNKLKFDGDGGLAGSAGSVSFTLSAVKIHSVKLDSTKLRLDADRMAVEFQGDSWTLVPLGERLSMEITAPTNSDYSAALDRIFFISLAQYVPRLPAYWRFYGEQHFLATPLHPGAELGTLPGAAKPSPGSGEQITNPVVLTAPAPLYNAKARKMKKSGNVLIYLEVDQQGLPQNVQILQPFGFGLDEEAVRAYRFRPATQNGIPVPVEMKVAVNFNFF